MGRKLEGGRAPLGEGELGPHLTQCGQGWGLPACQVSSWSVQPFGHNTPTVAQLVNFRSCYYRNGKWHKKVGKSTPLALPSSNTSHSAQNRSFQRHSSYPICWRSTEETKSNTTSHRTNTSTHWDFPFGAIRICTVYKATSLRTHMLS